MKVIKEFEHLTVSGKNLYQSADTIIYWNSINQANIAQVVQNSYEGNSKLKVVVPCCLPEYNKVVVCNSVGCHTGIQTYRYVGSPEITNFSPSSQIWGEEVIVKGKHLEDITGMFVGDIEVISHNLPSRKKIIFTTPDALEEGLITIYTRVAKAVSSQKLTGIRPDMNGTLVGYPKYYNQSGIVEGQSLDSVNRVELQGINQKVIYSVGVNLRNDKTTGLRFNTPEGTIKDSSIKLQNVTGAFVNGVYQSAIKEQVILEQNLDLKSVYIDGHDKDRDIYQEPIRVSGVNLDKAKIFFKGYDGSYIEGPYINSGIHHKTVSVPKHIRSAPILASGIGGEYTGLAAGSANFYPLPTIFHVDKTSWTMGAPVSIEAINASEMVLGVGVTGHNLIDGETDTFFVSSEENAKGSINHFGHTTIDNTELLTSPQSGFTRVTALINSTMAGDGKAFLVSSAEAPSSVNFNNITTELKNSYSYQNIDKITYSSTIKISGKTPSVLGVSLPKSPESGQIGLTGKYFLGLTGVSLGGQGLEYRVLPAASLLGINGQIINIINSGQGNAYERPHLISMNIEDFGFTGKNGTFTILIP